jgi:hypothetical protein
LRKTIIPGALFVTLLALLLIAGCGNKTTIDTPEGSASVEDNGGTITYNQGGETGSISQSQTAPTESELGAPIYPGVEYNAENSGSADYSNQGASTSSITAEFLTGDSFSQVTDWYKGKLGNTGYIESDLAQWTIGDLATGNYTIVAIENDGGQTKITITHMSTSVK